MAIPASIVALEPPLIESVTSEYLPLNIVATVAPDGIGYPPELGGLTAPASSLTAANVAAVAVGASFTALTVIATVSVPVKAPPMPVLPRSLVTIVKLSAPL